MSYWNSENVARAHINFNFHNLAGKMVALVIRLSHPRFTFYYEEKTVAVVKAVTEFLFESSYVFLTT